MKPIYFLVGFIILALAIFVIFPKNTVSSQINELARQVVGSPTTEFLRGIDMLSESDGWKVGQNGTILHYCSLLTPTPTPTGTNTPTPTPTGTNTPTPTPTGTNTPTPTPTETNTPTPTPTETNTPIIMPSISFYLPLIHNDR